MKFKKVIAAASMVASFMLVVSVASAHVVVSPKEVGIGKYQTFSVGVPVEKDIATVGIRLVIPEALGSATPNVKPGWKITFTKVKTGKQAADHHGNMVDEERISEVIWTGGAIPAGQRDDFLFSAKAPAEVSSIQWKAYQTYADGSVVAWDAAPQAVADQKKAMDEVLQKDPNAKMIDAKLNPYSETKVIDDLAVTEAPPVVTDTTNQDINTNTRNSQVALAISVVSLLLAAAGLRKKS